jgi:hypothetical protein
MNKKYIAFGFLGVFVFALVSAGLVNYLSDTTTADISVESPIDIFLYFVITIFWLIWITGLITIIKWIYHLT